MVLGTLRLMCALRRKLCSTSRRQNVQQAIEFEVMTRLPGVPFWPRQCTVISVFQRVPEEVRKQLSLRAMLKVTGPWSDGSLAGIVVDLKTGVLNAGTDPRTEAYAWAW
jgi:hypothetical protein